MLLRFLLFFVPVYVRRRSHTAELVLLQLEWRWVTGRTAVLLSYCIWEWRSIFISNLDPSILHHRCLAYRVEHLTEQHTNLKDTHTYASVQRARKVGWSSCLRPQWLDGKCRGKLSCIFHHCLASVVAGGSSGSRGKGGRVEGKGCAKHLQSCPIISASLITPSRSRHVRALIPRRNFSFPGMAPC